MSTVLMSIKQRFADAIFGEQKQYELRRVRPRIAEGSIVWLYATKPCGAVVGWFEAGVLLSGAPEDLWLQIGNRTGVGHVEFLAYLDGCDVAYALEVRRSVRTSPQPLPGSRRAPQSYRFLGRDEAAWLGAG